MNWQKEAKEKLMQYNAMCQAAENIPKGILRLSLDARSLRSTGLRVPCSGGCSREDALLNNIVRRQELQLALKRTNCWLETTRQALSVIDRQERLILDALYIRRDKASVEKLCQQLGMEQSTVYRHRDKALKNFTLALYGFPEDFTEASLVS